MSMHNTSGNEGYISDNTPFAYEKRPPVHIPLSDVDDLPFKNRQDPNFIASISKAFFFNNTKLTA
jgi:hypothetical protein